MFFKKRQRTKAELLTNHLLFWTRVAEDNRVKEMLEKGRQAAREAYARQAEKDFPPEGHNCRCSTAFIESNLPVDRNGWPVSVGRFETVADAFNAGKTVRRVGWKSTVSGIVKLPNTRFVTLLLPNGTNRSWQPYAEDFAADDWYVV